mgnify:CR=1 FL=1
MGASIGKRNRGIPMPIMPTENIGMMSGAIRKKRRDKKKDERGSRRGVRSLGLMQVTMQDPKTGQLYGGLVKDGVPQFKAPDGSTPQGFPNINERVVSRRPEEFRFDPSKPSAVQETTRVNVQDPTLGGPPEREVPIPKERRPRITRESDPRGPAPFAPDDNAAKDRFFETMFERAANQKERRAIDKGERRDRQEAMRDEAMMRDSEMGGNRRRRRDFTRRRPEKRRSREERAAFRDRYVSTLGSNFFS